MNWARKGSSVHQHISSESKKLASACKGCLIIVLELDEAGHQQFLLNRMKAWVKMWKILRLCS